MVGVDVAAGRWVAVVLASRRFDRVLTATALDEILAQAPAAVAVAVDIPIGLSEAGADWPRPSDLEARRRLRGRASSVFLSPPRPILGCPAYPAASALHRRITGKGLSKQAWNLCERIREADGVAARDDRVVEAHPELSFASIAAGGALPTTGLPYPKKTWNGQHLRRRLLEGAGIQLPDHLDGSPGLVAADDLLDAAAAAWTALRFASGSAHAIGELVVGCRPNRHAGRIWV